MSASSIHFNILVKRFRFTGKENIQKWISKVATKEGFSISRIDFIFCDDSYLLSLNKQFLKHNTLTDILTFDYVSDVSPDKLCGEIYISLDRVRENAELFDVSFHNELMRVIVHGILHLCGYKDKSKAEKLEMKKKENLYLTLQKK